MSAPRLLTHRTVSTTASKPGAWWAHRLPPVVAWTLCALFAGGLGLASTLGPHRVWGATAAGGYLAAALLSGLGQGAWRRRAVRVAAAGSVLVPLVLLVLRGQGQLELDVVQRSGERLLSTGVPYLDRPAALADYNPYLPGMAVFGLPRALLGDVVAGDARWWFTLSFLAVIAVSARITAGRRGSVGLAALAAFPAVALPLAVGGVDLPVSALMCLALALAGTGRPGGTGLALGAAASLKWTAWPLVPVALVLLATVRGRSAALRALAVTVAVAGTVVIPSVLATPNALLEHTVLFPTGAGVTASPADSPLPGHLLAAHVPGGRALALALLALAAAAVGTSLLTHPPRTVVAASDRLALGLALAICLAPATRFGYLVVPFVLVGWVRLRPDSLDPGDRMHTVAVPRQHPTGRHAPRRRLRWTHALLRRLGRRASFVEAEIDGLDRVVREGDVCLDIGAEYGLYTYALAHLAGPGGTVHSFEPLPDAHRVLRAGTRILGCRTVTTHRVALGRSAGTHPMSVPYRHKLPVHGRAFVTDGAHGIGPNAEFPEERRLMVQVRTLDALTDARTGGPLPERIDFIKADVEGAEPLVVEGARATLLRNRPALLLEIEARHLAKYGEHPDRLVGRLHELGYAMYVWRDDHWHPVDRVTEAHRNYLFTIVPPEA